MTRSVFLLCLQSSEKPADKPPKKGVLTVFFTGKHRQELLDFAYSAYLYFEKAPKALFIIEINLFLSVTSDDFRAAEGLSYNLVLHLICVKGITVHSSTKEPPRNAYRNQRTGLRR